jgi:nucleoid DNA-binding protein
MTTKGELIDQLYNEELLWLDRTDARDAIETVLGHVIATLRADHRISARTLLAGEEFFIDAVNRAAMDGPHD